MSLRLATATGLLLAVATTLLGVFVWYWAEAAKQSAAFGGVQVFPNPGAIALPALAAVAITTTATTILCRAADRYVVAALGASASIATAYGIFGSSLYDGEPPYVIGTIFKASGIALLGLVALAARSRLLGFGLL